MSASPGLPSGTVTFLFTDVEGSTRMLQDLGEDRYAEALDEHRRAVRKACVYHGGVEIDTQGDAFFFAFPTAPGGLQAAQAAQEALSIPVRMGVHTGTPLLTDEGYVGTDVHRAARIAAAGHGGQVLLSQTTRDLAAPSAELLDLGLHRLKDLSEPQRLYQLGTEAFAPLNTLAQTNLPVPATPFVGRERELEDVGRLLRTSRLLTLTGPGGTGKTRLAAQSAAEAASEFSAGVWWVPLAALRDPALVPEAISEALGARSDLAQHIGDQEMLIVLDNVEQLVGAGSELGALLEGCRGLRLLVTSRAPLKVAAEQEYAVPPFALGEAAEFFSARARAAQSGFEPTEAVADICRRLDNLPLALELAAARIKVLSPEQILARLERALPILTGGPRDAPERQRTLEGAIAWSYDMLTAEEQRLFAELSVFVGGWTLEAAEVVCDADLDTLGSLVDKSLVRQARERFSMLATIGEFARERLRERSVLSQVSRRHAEYFLDGAERNYGVLLEDLTPAQLGWFEHEHGNLRAALDRLHQPDGDPKPEMRLAIACGKFWVHRGLFAEGRQRQEDALARADTAPSVLRGRLLWVVAESVSVHGGDYLRAKDLATQAIQVLDSLDADPLDVIAAGNSLAICEQRLGNYARSAELQEELVLRARAAGNDLALAFVLLNTANLALDERDFQRARPALIESAALAKRRGQWGYFANALVDLGFVALAEGDVDDGAEQFRQSLSICHEERIRHTLLWAIEGLATVAAEHGDPALATQLLAATERLRAELGFDEGYYTLGDEFRERTLAAARQTLGEAEYAEAWAEGTALSDDDAAQAAARVS